MIQTRHIQQHGRRQEILDCVHQNTIWTRKKVHKFSQIMIEKNWALEKDFKVIEMIMMLVLILMMVLEISIMVLLLILMLMT